MHCPSCGKPATTDQQFCRACGMSLETISKLVAQHAGTPIADEKLERREAERLMVRRMFNWIMWGIIMIGIGTAMLVFNKTFEIGKWFKLVSTLTVLGGCGVTVAGVVSTMRRGTQLPSGPRIKELPTSAEPEQLATHQLPKPLPSITERTTQLISEERDT